jgi:hypothetical protein
MTPSILPDIESEELWVDFDLELVVRRRRRSFKLKEVAVDAMVLCGDGVLGWSDRPVSFLVGAAPDEMGFSEGAS